MKAPPLLGAFALIVANLLLPELETLLDAFHWSRVSVGAWWVARKMTTHVLAQSLT
jgi:hypothetical protein